MPDSDIPLKRAAPSGGWIGGEPTAYGVRAQHPEKALTLAVYCHYVLRGRISAKYAGRVSEPTELLSDAPGRLFRVLCGRKPGPAGAPQMATEIEELEPQQ